jgi:hypothetical protein
LEPLLTTVLKIDAIMAGGETYPKDLRKGVLGHSQYLYYIFGRSTAWVVFIEWICYSCPYSSAGSPPFRSSLSPQDHSGIFRIQSDTGLALAIGFLHK